MIGFLFRGVNDLIDLLMALAKRFLQMAQQFLMLPFGEIQVVIGKLGELLPELPF
jgi:hypothetical protein